MPTTIELSEQELAELRTYTKEMDDVAALRSAMNEYLRFARRMQLKALSGKLHMEDNWQSLEASELSYGKSSPGAH